MTAISAAICWDAQGRVLICQRGPGGSCAYLWEFPGGKIEPGESAEDCLVRECQEELGVQMAVGPCVAESTYRYVDREVYIRFFHAALVQGEPQLHVHEAMLWAEPQTLSDFDFCPADEAVIAQIKSGAIHP